MTPDLRLGRWQDVLADVEACDALICDPPYSDRVHAGQRTGSSIDAASLGYRSITASEPREIAARFAPIVRKWVVLFCDNATWMAHEMAWLERDWYTFVPVYWVKPNATPRLSGDGPTCSAECMMIARPRRRLADTDVGSRPGHYTHNVARNPIVAGSKPLDLMRAIVRDYSRPGDLIVDPYAGGGTTLLAALLEGRRSIGAEVDPKTHALASQRLRGLGPESPTQPNLFSPRPRI